MPRVKREPKPKHLTYVNSRGKTRYGTAKEIQRWAKVAQCFSSKKTGKRRSISPVKKKRVKSISPVKNKKLPLIEDFTLHLDRLSNQQLQLVKEISGKSYLRRHGMLDVSWETEYGADVIDAIDPDYYKYSAQFV